MCVFFGGITQAVSPVRYTCVVLDFKMELIELVDVADVHLLFIQLCLVEVLINQKEQIIFIIM